MYTIKSPRIVRLLTLAAVAVCGPLMAMAGESAGRYVNPLSIEDTRSVADPTIVRFHDKYYMFLTGGTVWVSNDLVTWWHEHAAMPTGERVNYSAKVLRMYGLGLSVR